jgi:cytochrome c-type biogenesis protein CcmE
MQFIVKCELACTSLLSAKASLIDLSGEFIMLHSPRMKFIVGGFVILAAVVYLIVTATQASAEYFMTIDELKARRASVVNKNVRASGAIIGDTISYDPQSLTLKFMVANVSGDNNEIERLGGLGAALHQAVIDPTRSRLQVVYKGPKPDLLRNEAQAIMTGHLAADGVFYADELLLKCPTKYQQAVPNQVESN